MEYMVGIVICVILASIVALLWSRGIDFMKQNHPDYKGEDFLNWHTDEDDENNIY